MLHSNIVKSTMLLNILPIERIWNFERRSRDYRRVYRDVAKDIADGIIRQNNISYERLKMLHNTYKTHRDIGVIERSYLKSPVYQYTGICVTYF